MLDLATYRGARRRAAARAVARGAPARILVVCHGNICRSPYAAAALSRQFAALDLAEVVVESAGFIGPGRPAHDVAIMIGATRGLDLRSHQSRLVCSADATSFDLALVMTHQQRQSLIVRHGFDPHQVELLGDFDGAGGARREIPDPYGRPLQEFEQVFDQLDRATASLVALWAVAPK